ncbi:MAG: hypothetical protein HY825_05400 [Acidobacteria bacterium]|nr:hypothetical protein [Acidobacteriota bacterium]
MRLGPGGRWTLAVVVALASAVWQRTSGPTYPVRGRVQLGGQEIGLRLTRSHGGGGDQAVRVAVADSKVTGEVAWRRFPTRDAWQVMPIAREDDGLGAALPHQPPAGKLEYQVRLRRGEETVQFPPRPAVTRFKGDVSPAVLIPHIFAMFAGMLFSNRAGLEAWYRGPSLHRQVWITVVLLGIGGFILGPAVQKAAFGAWWTGVPFGWDLTDNKTLIAGLAWAFALWRMRGGRAARGAVVAAALATLVVFAIPHSVWGSEIDWDHPATSPLLGP